MGLGFGGQSGHDLVTVFTFPVQVVKVLTQIAFTLAPKAATKRNAHAPTTEIFITSLNEKGYTPSVRPWNQSKGGSSLKSSGTFKRHVRTTIHFETFLFQANVIANATELDCDDCSRT